ncbi:MAG: acyl-CoA dehydrogenase [Myxococcales bacterium]|nr:acyl-CoA dehydrogenase [Myxococcales bacterium]MDD9971934.1 acyl-CoA dehydrogenase [Myxococcales bacterium]
MNDNPLIHDRTLEFLLYEVLDVERLCRMPYFQDHSRQTFEMFVGSCRKFAREVLRSSYKPMDEAATSYEGGRVVTHPQTGELVQGLVDLGLVNATRPYEVEGQQLPSTIMLAANAYVTAANLSVQGFCMLTTGAAHLIEAFGSDELKETYMRRMYAGEWTGTMALTEPQAGSGLADIQTRATPTEEGHYLIQGSKVFISGGDNSFSENIVHLVLARIDGAPLGTKGISLFVVPRLRPEGEELLDNDVDTAGAFHKLGWRAIPSIALNFGEEGRCRGYLVGEPHRGLRYMFQMMNEARLGVGASAMATAMVAYEEALAYAKTRPQGRRFDQRATDPPANIIEHPDVRRMLLRQKAICEGALSLLLTSAHLLDRAEHGPEGEDTLHAATLVELLTPIAKTFPAEKGFESNVLAVQVLGGYGYTSEYLPEALLRDQKLNSIHEGTTGIQSLDLLGRKVLGTGGASLVALSQEFEQSSKLAAEAGVPAGWGNALMAANRRIADVTATLGARALEDPTRGLQHSVDYLDMVATAVLAWQWLLMATAAAEGLQTGAATDKLFYEGKLKAAQYWFATELPRVTTLADMITIGDDAFMTIPDEGF